MKSHIGWGALALLVMISAIAAVYLFLAPSTVEVIEGEPPRVVQVK